MPNSGKHYTKEEHALMVRLWSDGYTMKEIADELGRTWDSVGSRIRAKRYDFPYRRPKTTKAEREEMRELRARDWSYEKIARYLGVSNTTARNHAGDEKRMTCADTPTTKTGD